MLFNDVLNIFYMLYGIGYMIKNHLDSERKREREREREETRCCHYMGYTFRLAANYLLYTQTGYHLPRPLLH